MGLLPQSSGDLQCFDLEPVPPGNLIACLMQLPVMSAAERDGELVADLDPQGAWLCEAQVMRVAWMAPAYKARLGSDKTKMGFVAAAFVLW
jgi:hypothetical protein